MQNHCTTSELALVTGSTLSDVNSIINKALRGLPGNSHRVIRGRPRIVNRSDAERIVAGLQLYGADLTIESIGAVVNRPEINRILAGDARLLVLEASGALSAYDTIDDELLKALEAQNSLPVVMVDLRSVRALVEAAIEHAEVHRWGFDKSAFGKLAKSQAEIRAARDAFIARQKAEGV